MIPRMARPRIAPLFTIDSELLLILSTLIFFVIQTLLYRLLKDPFILLQMKKFSAAIEKLCYCDAKAMLLAPKSSAIAS